MYTGYYSRLVSLLIFFFLTFFSSYMPASDDEYADDIKQEDILLKETPEPTVDVPSLADYMNSGVPRVHDAVSIISGAWVDTARHATDMTAVDPYELCHVYSSNSTREGSLGNGWEFFHPSKIVFVTAYDEFSSEDYAYLHEAGGSIYTFKYRGHDKYSPYLRNSGHTFISSIKTPNRLSPHNTTIVYKSHIKVKLGDGTVRKYIDNNSKSGRTYYLSEEKSPNNIWKYYKYDSKNKIKNITTCLSNGEVVGKVSFKRDDKKITAILSSGQKVIFNLKEMKDKDCDIYIDCIASIQPQGSKEISFSYDQSLKHNTRVEKKRLSDGNTLVAKFYDQHTCTVDGEKYCPDDHGSSYKYLVNNRVRELYTKTLPGEKNPTLSHAFYYKKQGADYASATVKEKDGYVTSYLWNNHSGRLRWCVKKGPEGQKLRYERFIWDLGGKEDGRLLARVLFDESKKPILIKEWKYDSQGMVVQETLRGKFTSENVPDLVIDRETYVWKRGGEALVWKASYDDKRRKVYEKDPTGTWTEYTYVSDGRDLVQKKLVFSRSGKIIERTFYTYDSVAPLCIEKITDDGTDTRKENMQGVTSRTISRYTYRRQMPYWGAVLSDTTHIWTPTYGELLLGKKEYIRDARGRVSTENTFGSDNQLVKTASYKYDELDRITAVCYPDGSYEMKTYDASTGRITQVTSPKGTTRFTYDHSDRIIREDVSFPDGSSFTKHTSYDLFGRRTITSDERGRTTEVQKDSLDRPVYETLAAVVIDNRVIKPRITYSYTGLEVVKTLPHGATEKILLSSWNKPFYTQSANGATKTFCYDKLGREISRCDNHGFTTLTDYDEQGREIAIREQIDGIGERVVLEKKYDGERLIEESYPGYIKRYTYDGHNRKSREEIVDRVTGQSSAFSYKYDSLGRLQETVDEAKRIVSFQAYDSMDRVIETSVRALDDPTIFRSCTRSIYNSLGNLVETRVLLDDGKEAITTYTHGNYNTISSITNPEEKTTFFQTTLQKSGEGGLPYFVTTTIHPDGTSEQIWKDGYDAVTLTQVFDPLRRVISQRSTKINILGKPSIVTDTPYNPSTGDIAGEESVTRFEYDSVGNCVALHKGKKDEILRTWRYQYDLQNRRTHEIKPSGIELVSSYDNKGRLVSYASSDGSICYQYQYNHLDLPHRIEDVVSSQTIEREYNGRGFVISEKLPDNIDIAYEVNSAGQTTRLSSSYFSPVHYSYFAGALQRVEYKDYFAEYTKRNCQGAFLELEYSGGAILSCSYDALLRRRSVTFSRARGNASYFEEKRVDFDDMGRLLRRDLLLPPNGKTQVDNFSYDYLGQLRRENEEQYQFDSLHRATGYKGNTYTYNVLHEIASDDSISFDIDGRRVTDRQGKILEYDALDRLVSACVGTKKVIYSYDAFHRRTKRVVLDRETSQQLLVERFLYAGENEIGSLEGDEKKLDSFRVLGEGLGAEIGASLFIERNEKVYIPLHDLSGNVRLILNPQLHDVEEWLDYTAFGPKDWPVYVITPWTFSSKRYDLLTGYIFFGRRYYDPSTLSWITLDPLGYEAGPNLYAYVKNSPLSSIDLYGLLEQSSEGRSWFSRAWDWLCDKASSCWERLTSCFGDRSPSNDLDFYTSQPSHTVEGEMIKKDEKYETQLRLVTKEGETTKEQWIKKQKGNTLPRGSMYVMVNGIKTSLHETVARAKYILNKYDHIKEILIAYNSTDGFAIDLVEAISNVAGLKTEVVETLTRELDSFFSACLENNISFTTDWICHSQGAAIAKHLLDDRNLIIRQFTERVATLGGACMIKNATNYIAIGDPVPYTNPGSFLGAALRGFSDIKYLPFRIQTPIKAHEFSGPSYLQAVDNFITGI